MDRDTNVTRPQTMRDDQRVTKDYLDEKLAATAAKFRFALRVQSIAVIVLAAALYTLFL
jgi:hypothetical protein